MGNLDKACLMAADSKNNVVAFRKKKQRKYQMIVVTKSLIYELVFPTGIKLRMYLLQREKILIGGISRIHKMILKILLVPR